MFTRSYYPAIPTQKLKLIYVAILCLRGLYGKIKVIIDCLLVGLLVVSQRNQPDIETLILFKRPLGYYLLHL